MAGRDPLTSSRTTRRFSLLFHHLQLLLSHSVPVMAWLASSSQPRHHILSGKLPTSPHCLRQHLRAKTPSTLCCIMTRAMPPSLSPSLCWVRLEGGHQVPFTPLGCKERGHHDTKWSTTQCMELSTISRKPMILLKAARRPHAGTSYAWHLGLGYGPGGVSAFTSPMQSKS